MEDKMVDDIDRALKDLDRWMSPEQPSYDARRFATMLRAALPHLSLDDLSGRGRDEDMKIHNPR